MFARTGLIISLVAAALVATGCDPTQIVPGAWDETSPSIAGSSVAWEDSRTAETDGTNIYSFDTSTGVAKLVAGGKGDQEQPAISDRYVVWLDAGKLRALDRQSGTVFNVTSGAATQTDPALCGTVVTWTDSRNSTPDVYARNLAGGAEIKVAGSSAVEAYPACDAGRIAYMYAPSGQWASVRLYDMSTGKTTVVAEDQWNDWRPAISGDLVVWQAWPGQPDTVNGIQIFGKNLRTGSTFTVTSGAGNQTAPAISGTVVAWEDERSGVPRVWWRDLSSTTGEAEAVSIQAGRQEAPAVSGRTLTYQGDATGFWQIYTHALPGGT